jgi:hypothetical protein
MCIRVVACISMVSVIVILLVFLIVQPWVAPRSVSVGEFSWVEVILAVGAMLAAVFSACAAFAANSIAKTIERSDKIKRTLELSPYNCDRYDSAWSNLKDRFDEIECTGKLLSKEKAKSVLESNNLLNRDYLRVLNYWGRISSAYERDLIDKDLAENMFKVGFNRFFDHFGEYFGDKKYAENYPDTNSLRERWRNK